MNTFRIALANIRFPATPEESVTLAEQAIAQASIERAGIICFPECFIPGYRGKGKAVPPPDTAFLDHAWAAIAAAAAKANVTVVLGTERVIDGALGGHPAFFVARAADSRPLAVFAPIADNSPTTVAG